ncbi:glycosyltransferase [Nocardia amikacinitolerans]|uniref:glycosyltransferase n=1 Tax=Nocardia amikacinitolerans TaxID=756689 RepID=UPI0036772A61
MRIAMVSEHANPLAQLGGVDAGGQNVHVGELAAAFARRDHDVTVYTRRDDPALDTTITTDAGYRVVHVPAGPAKPIPKDDILPHLGEFATFLREQWSANRPDLVHAHFWMSAVAAELAASRELRIPVVLTFHALGTVKRRYQGAADTSPPARIKLERLVANRAHHVIATCTDEVEELGRMGLPHARATVVPCGVDLARFGPYGPADERGGGHRLVSVGRLVPRKGFDTTIKALALLPDTELLIAGGSADGDDPTGAESRRLHRVAVDAGVADRVHLLGQVTREAMPALLRSADVVVCTPWYEPFGMVPLEAMACGKPVVASAVGGLLDTVVDGVTGSLVDPPDPRPVARALRPLLADDALRRAWGTAGYERAHGRYSWDRVADETLTAYHRVIPEAATATLAAAG